ncbi:hypothetical protein K402DRAFT_330232 [Aulographum hederae CBS 113979]|uniref:AMMECR1 domain-containing protein n=1 Tax=Aulographum hederae CBS 113979 TaxID=1176131 RepID=A0A6G1H3K1_9PEZI|nr:hypothetical protein K402DRAFT_330232 [Aulographum hederae CBS 113979]
MATQAHCAYCFESLSANLEKRTPLSLQQVEDLWEEYKHASEEALADTEMKDVADEPSVKPPAANRLVVPSPSSSSVPSASSSTPSLTAGSSAASKSSSRSSLFSFKRSKKNKSSSDLDEHPLFVTWNTISRSGNKSLRGCIGTFEAQELSEGLRSYALTSALDDHRFSPISARELQTLECAVTLLTDFETAPSPMSWEIGKHGLRISFNYHGRRYGATYLPDVAREQGWTKEETLVSLMRKAGWSGRKEEWSKVADLNVVRYQGLKVDVDYKEWRDWRDWVEETGRE